MQKYEVTNKLRVVKVQGQYITCEDFKKKSLKQHFFSSVVSTFFFSRHQHDSNNVQVQQQSSPSEQDITALL